MTAPTARPSMTAGELCALFGSMEPDTPVGVKLDPWAPVGRVVRRVNDAPDGDGVIVHIEMQVAEWP